MSDVLEEVAATADELADEQRRVARAARRMAAERERGWTWARILDRETAPGLLERLRRSVRLLTRATTGVAETVARGLRDEGESRRRIARRLGVTHQRVSAIVTARRRGSRPAGDAEHDA